jgi:hypothetical protein
MGKNVLIKTSIGKSPNEMGNYPFASHLVASLMLNIVLVHYLRYECVISIHATLFDFHQSIPWIFVNVPPVVSPIGEYPLNFRQYKGWARSPDPIRIINFSILKHTLENLSL